MSRNWRLTQLAEESLIEIANWTLTTCGPRQASAYEEDLIAVCREIAAGAALSQACHQLIDLDLPEGLRFARAGQNFVIFVEGADQVIIIDFLHARSDLPRRLAGLPDPAGDTGSSHPHRLRQPPITPDPDRPGHACLGPAGHHLAAAMAFNARTPGHKREIFRIVDDRKPAVSQIDKAFISPGCS